MLQNINLYAGARRRRAAFSRSGIAAIGVAFVAAVAALYAVEAERARALRASIAAAERSALHLERQLAAAPAAARRAFDELDAMEAEVAALEAIATRLDSGLLGRTSGFTEPLRALAGGSTPGVWLTGIRIENAGQQLALEGKALDAARVPALIERLAKLPQFEGTAFATLEMKPAEEAGTRAPASTVRFRLATAAAEKAGAK
jgi:Tfp pilus assembly protein PilN